MRYLKVFEDFEEVQLPEKIGHNYKPVKILPLSDLEKFKEHRRLKTFYYKGCKCVNFEECGNEGIYLIEAIDKHKVPNKHIDLYTKDFNLMTVDHIQPLAKGGLRYDINNLQPMCQKCNELKADKY